MRQTLGSSCRRFERLGASGRRLDRLVRDLHGKPPPVRGGAHLERSGSSGVMAVMVVAIVAIVVVFLLVSGVFAPQNGGIDIHL